MVGRVPVLGQHHVPKTLGEAVDDRHHLVAVRDRKPAGRAKIVLDIDHDQDVVVAGRHCIFHCSVSRRAERRPASAATSGMGLGRNCR